MSLACRSPYRNHTSIWDLDTPEATCLSGGVEMRVAQSVVVHLELEDSVHVGQRELDAVYLS